MVSVADYLSSVHNRDLVTAFFQWVPMILGGTAGAAGATDCAASLLKLSHLADGYRAVTRFSGLFELFSGKALTRIAQSATPVERSLATLDFVCDAGFFLTEHLAVLQKFGITTAGNIQFATLALFFWFWGLTVKIVGVSHELFAEVAVVGGSAHATPTLVGGGEASMDATAKRVQSRIRKLRLGLLKLVCYWLFAMSSVTGKMAPFPVGSALAALNVFFLKLTPPRLKAPLPVRGTFGLVATLCDVA